MTNRAGHAQRFRQKEPSNVQFLRDNRLAPWVVYLLATLPIFLPLLFGSGFILVLDMVFAPHIPMPTELTNTYPFYALLHGFDVILPAFIIQKLLLISIFALAGTGMYQLLNAWQWRPKNSQTTNNQLHLWQGAAYFAGLFYMYNPFTYTRLMAGQYLVLLGYALLPFFIRSLYAFVQAPSLRSSLWLAGTTTAIAVTSIHTLGIAIIVSLVLLAAQFVSRSGRTQAKVKTYIKYGLTALAAVSILNSFWLVPVLGGNSILNQAVTNFSVTDFRAFATSAGEFGVTQNVLALQGFWGDEQNLYLLPQDMLSWWWLPIIVLWSLVLVGLIWSWRHQRKVAAICSTLGLIGLVLAVGMTGSIFAPLNEWLTSHVPLFAGYREPGKFAMLLVVAYAYFAAAGLYWLGEYAKTGHQRRIIIGASFLLPFFCAPLLIWGASGQLHAKRYPADWYTANQLLNDRRTEGDKALFLPWHLYMPMRFSSGVTASPAAAFFDIPIIASNDPELSGAAPYQRDNDRRAVNQLLASAADNSQFTAELQRIGIRYIIMAKEFDYKKYDFLRLCTGLEPILETPTLTVYQIEKSN